MADGEPNTFHWADYVILAAFLIFSALVGVIVGFINRRKNVDAKDFLTGGGDMHYVPVGMSLTSSFMSSIFVISIPSEIYVYGSTYAFLAISYFFSFTFAGHVHLPVYHRLGITSGYHYLEMRFSRSVRLAGSVTFSMMMFLYNGVVLYTPAVALSQASGMETYVSILLVGGVVTFYTALGGLKATIWNDAFQMTVILINFVLIIIFGSLDKEVNGLDRALALAKESGVDKLYDSNTYSFDPFVRTSFWTQTIGGTFMNIVLFSSSQTVIQKFISVKSICKGKIAVWISAAMTALYMCLVFFIGCVIYAKYQYCDPLTGSKQVEKVDQIMSLFVLDIMGHLPGLPGLYLAAAFSATLSTVAAGLNAMAAVYLEDFINPAYEHFKGKPLGESIAKHATRILAIVFGLLTIAVAFLSEVLGDVAVQIALSIFGMVGAPLCGAMSLGMFFPVANKWGALSGLFTSLILTLWIGIAPIVQGVPNVPVWKNNTGCDSGFSNSTTEIPDIMTTTAEPEFLKIYELSYVYYSLFALLVAFIVGVTVSVLTGGNKDPEKLNPRLYYFFQENVGCLCPYKCQTGGRCGVPLDEEEESIAVTAADIKGLPKSGTEIGFKDGISDDPLDNISAGSLEKPPLPTINGLGSGKAYENEGYTNDMYADTEELDPFYDKLDFTRQSSNEDSSTGQKSDAGDSGVVMTTEL